MSEQNNSTKVKKPLLTLKEIVLFALFGTLMFCSKLLMELLPNIHLLGMFICVFTIVFRKKALIPIYVYVMLNGVYAGFAPWWVPYLYVWTILWGMVMLLPKKMPLRVASVVYPLVCALHGAIFGILYAPGQALMFGLTFKETVTWVLTGLSFDLLHSIGDFLAGLLIVPLSVLLKKTIAKI